ncbi:probable E3 ubiquitin-protein ligase RNF217 [Papaver somniferum]|uniref:probable E3 ubiquitin-protein ligase RNF217 n=1 Tax=Papaver somniferum TaxID=3469 RepID=UPI000E7044FD|nr:probable E3 ubiquitin-protein ligase RNF217 [Papaver somniferum]
MEEMQHKNPRNSTSVSHNGNRFFTCEICVETVPMKRKFKNMETNACLHPYCTNCVAKYIQAKLVEHNISEIKCPNTDCNILLDASLCQSALPKKVFENWCRVLCGSAVLLDSSKGGLAHGRSYCPYRDCLELVLNECVTDSHSSNNTGITKSNCPNCKKLFCFQCMVPWKENHRCIGRTETVIDIDSNDVLFIEILKLKKWRRCPACHHYVERNEGCRWVTCRCRKQFCHDCGSDPCVCHIGRGLSRGEVLVPYAYVFMILVTIAILFWMASL